MRTASAYSPTQLFSKPTVASQRFCLMRSVFLGLHLSLEFFLCFAAGAPVRVCKDWAHIDYYDNEKVIKTYYSECEVGVDVTAPARESSRFPELRTSCAKQRVRQGPWPLITTFAQSSESRRASRRCPTRSCQCFATKAC